MTKPTRITVDWQPIEGEFLRVTIEAPTSYPDVIAEITARARQLMRDVHADIMAQDAAGD